MHFIKLLVRVSMEKFIGLFIMEIKSNMLSKLFLLPNSGKIRSYKNVQSTKSIFSAILSLINILFDIMTCLRLQIISILSINTAMVGHYKIYYQRKENYQNQMLYKSSSSYFRPSKY